MIGAFGILTVPVQKPIKTGKVVRSCGVSQNGPKYVDIVLKLQMAEHVILSKDDLQY